MKIPTLQSHRWEIIDVLIARCPYCGQYIEGRDCPVEKGDEIQCTHCGDWFILGRLERDKGNKNKRKSI